VKKHKRLTPKDRELLLKLSAQPYNQTQIAQMMGCSQSAISRELRRDEMNRLSSSIAKAQVDRNIKVAKNGGKKKLSKGCKLLNRVKARLSEHRSPEQVSSILKKGSKCNRRVVSHETIYQYIFHRGSDRT
jgi:IS30 family transposase